MQIDISNKPPNIRTTNTLYTDLLIQLDEIIDVVNNTNNILRFIRDLMKILHKHKCTLKQYPNVNGEIVYSLVFYTRCTANLLVSRKTYVVTRN